MLLSSGDSIMWEEEMFNGWESQGTEAVAVNLGNLMAVRVLGWCESLHSICEKRNWTKA